MQCCHQMNFLCGLAACNLFARAQGFFRPKSENMLCHPSICDYWLGCFFCESLAIPYWQAWAVGTSVIYDVMEYSKTSRGGHVRPYMFVTPWNTGSVGMDVGILDWQPYPNAFVPLKERQWFQKLAHWPVGQCTSFCHGPLGMQTVRYFCHDTEAEWSERFPGVHSAIHWERFVVPDYSCPAITMIDPSERCEDLAKSNVQKVEATLQHLKTPEDIEWEGTTEHLANYLRAKNFFHSDLSPGHVCLDYFRHTSGYAWGPNCRMASRLDISASW